MSSPVQLIPGAISELFASVSETQVLTLGDRYGIMAALLDETLSEEEQRAINRLLRGAIKGRIEVIKI
ncbi:hypothetical protein [Oscillatoria sp. FACHB-1406]|uniref:hypothetical protein n=1 Tax=Oscillatoria sp. FACHB-1406 TaxID=2692846 RepID=UPI001684D19A|nr:hypothetical protein [Oscillatoria sp. FACHB-1406]MBD2577251.1 hypothetical protein [Oscillatoria sp. FACHB-1406]